MRCPCCGATIYVPDSVRKKVSIEEAISKIPFTLYEQRIVYTLHDKEPAWVSTDNLIYSCYWDKDEPENAYGCIKQRMRAIKKKLAPLGITVDSKPGSGYRLVVDGYGG